MVSIRRLKPLFGADFEELSPEKLIERLEAGSPGAGMMHVASHGIFQEQDPYFSALSLGARSLLAHDIARMTLDLDLATLSGCETGRRRRIGGEEPFGLAHAFLCAGTRSVLGSLWDVEDRATLAFVTSFYEELAAGQSVRKAACDGEPQTVVLAASFQEWQWGIHRHRIWPRWHVSIRPGFRHGKAGSWAGRIARACARKLPRWHSGWK